MRDPARLAEFEKFFSFSPTESLDRILLDMERAIVRNELLQLVHLLKYAELKARQEEVNQLNKKLEKLWQLAEEFDRLPPFRD